MKAVKQSVQFLSEVVQELKKVSWSSRKAVAGATAVVILLILVVSAFISLVDFVLAQVFGVFLR